MNKMNDTDNIEKWLFITQKGICKFPMENNNNDDKHTYLEFIRSYDEESHGIFRRSQVSKYISCNHLGITTTVP